MLARLIYNLYLDLDFMDHCDTIENDLLYLEYLIDANQWEKIKKLIDN